jgi:hypothetical protein
MAKIYITEHERPSVVFGNLMPVAKMPPLATMTAPIGVGSTQSSGFGTSTYMVCIHADTICSIEFGSNPTATTSSRRVASNATEYFEVVPGQKVAVIVNT